jgi:acetylornithine deacetylase/succinyl-diaminopimelate desuccinylase-like protein
MEIEEIEQMIKTEIIKAEENTILNQEIVVNVIEIPIVIDMKGTIVIAMMTMIKVAKEKIILEVEVRAMTRTEEKSEIIKIN